jgi:hypothetical protein
MDGSVGVDRSAAEVLVGALEAMLAELTATADGDNGWLRPLAILSAEIEYGALRSPRVDPSNVIDACCELHHLLLSCRDEGEFASRYARAVNARSVIGTLHERALVACRAVAASVTWPTW